MTNFVSGYKPYKISSKGSLQLTGEEMSMVNLNPGDDVRKIVDLQSGVIMIVSESAHDSLIEKLKSLNSEGSN